MASRSPLLPEDYLPDIPPGAFEQLQDDPPPPALSPAPSSAPAPKAPRRLDAPMSVEERPSQQDAIAMGLPYLATAVVGGLALLILPLVINGALPATVVLLAGLQAGGYLMGRTVRAPRWARIWLANFVIIAGLFPLLAVQTQLARTPYIASDRGTLIAPIVATVAAVAMLLAVAVFVAALAWEAPEQASLLFVPAALLVPATISMGSGVGQSDAVRGLAAVMLTAALVVAAAWMLPRGIRPLMGPIALGGQFIFLWVRGHGASFPASSGDVTPFLYSVLLATAIVLTVVVPLIAVWLRRLSLDLRQADDVEVSPA